MTQLWGGRFEGSLDDAAKALSFSLHFDYVLFPYDIQVNKAHVDALHQVGVLSDNEVSSLQDALDTVLKTHQGTVGRSDHDDEDVHSFVEREVIALVGDLGKKMHTGKSRNDQVATDMRLYLKDAALLIREQLISVQKAFWTLAGKHQDLMFPGFTHLQIAQPVLFAHHLLAYVDKLERDVSRLDDVLKRLDFCPLGSAAMVGSNYPIDRHKVAIALGFSAPTSNSMDAVSDRDFILEFLSVASLVMAHLSQFSEELIFWSSSVVGFVTIGDEYTTGSSIMPQKKNPDIAELIRGNTGLVLGDFVALHELIKGLPLTYNRDLQEDKRLMCHGVQTLQLVLECMVGMVPTITVHSEAIQNALETGHVLATELADYLVGKGLPFRDAHEVVGQLVQLADQKGLQIHTLSLNDLQSVSKVIESDVTDCLQLASAIGGKLVYGGTAKNQLVTQLQRIQEEKGW